MKNLLYPKLFFATMRIFHPKHDKIDKFNIIISNLIRALVIIAAFGAILTQRWFVFFICILAILFTYLPDLVRKNYEFYIPPEFEIIMVIFIYFSLILGEVHGYYETFWWWDSFLHAGSGLALGVIGFLLLLMLYDEKKINASPIILVIFSFCFALALGGLWEIFEFSMDQLIGSNMQKSGLVDTMWDLIVDALGAFVASALGWLYLKGGQPCFINRIVYKFVVKNPKLFGKLKLKRMKC
ncbi:hypothetical protein HN385_01105 [archaeon]|jgi:hypothetical protein|nr:hypothetical protein [archaeon]